MDGTTDHMGPVADPANRAVRLAASVCVWDMEIPLFLLSLYGRVYREATCVSRDMVKRSPRTRASPRPEYTHEARGGVREVLRF